MVQTKFLLLSLLVNKIVAESSSGSLDDSSISSPGDESNIPGSVADGSTANPSEDTSNTSEETTNNSAETSNHEITNNEDVPQSVQAPTTVVNTDTVPKNQAYAVAPSATVITTNAQGQTTTQLLWYVASNAVNSIPTDITNSAKSDKDKRTTQTTDGMKTVSSAGIPSTKTTDGPLTTLVGTYSNGVGYTSVLWWLPSTTTNRSGSHITTTLSSEMSGKSTHKDSSASTDSHSSINKKQKSTSSKTHSISSYHNSTNVANKLSKNAIGLAAVMLLL